MEVDTNSTSRVTVNSFLADGGSGFSILTDGTERTGGMLDLDALIAYFESADNVAPAPMNRFSRLH